MIDDAARRLANARPDLADAVNGFTLPLQGRFHLGGTVGGNHQDHADAAIEGAAHLLGIDGGCLCQPLEDRRQGPVARIDIGLHLDWTSEFAQAAGHGLSLGAAMRRALLGGFDRSAARTVIERQLDLFEAQWQAPPDHVDGHQHVQQFAGIREPLVELLARRYPGRLPYLRVSQVRSGVGERLGFKSRVISALGETKIDLKKAARVIGAAKLSFGSEARLCDALGVRPGSVTALALVNDPDGNWLEFSSELALVEGASPIRLWAHEERTLNSWGAALLRS